MPMGSGSGHWPACADAPGAAVAAAAAWPPSPAAGDGGASLAHWAATGFDLDALDLVDVGKPGAVAPLSPGSLFGCALRGATRGARAPRPSDGLEPALDIMDDGVGLSLDAEPVAVAAAPVAAPAPRPSRAAGGHRLRPRSAAPRLTRAAGDDDDPLSRRVGGLRKAPSAAATLWAERAESDAGGADADDASDPVAAYLSPAARRKGKGGRQPALDPRLDPGIDPKRAKRILANRLSAARSKLKQKSHLEALRKKVDALAYHRACLAAELERARDAVRRGAAENADLAARVKALKAHIAAQGDYQARLEAMAGGAGGRGAAGV